MQKLARDFDENEKKVLFCMNADWDVKLNAD